MGIADHYYEEGGWNTVCYECGRKRKASQLKRHWQGYYVCPEHWEARQPQDFVRAQADIQTPPWVQPMPADVFLFKCDFWSSAPMADYGAAGCLTVGSPTRIPFLVEYFNPTCIAGDAITGRSIAGVI